MHQAACGRKVGLYHQGSGAASGVVQVQLAILAHGLRAQEWAGVAGRGGYRSSGLVQQSACSGKRKGQQRRRGWKQLGL